MAEAKSVKKDKKEKKDRGTLLELPLLPLRDIVVFPHMVVPLFVGREKSISAIENAMLRDKNIILATQRLANIDEPGPEDIFTIGIQAEILQILKLPDNTVKVLVEGLRRVTIPSIAEQGGHFVANGKILPVNTPDTREVEALQRSVTAQFEKYVKLSRKIPPELLMTISTISEASKLADTISANLLVKIPDKQELLEITDTQLQLEKLLRILNAEVEIMLVEKKIHGKVKRQMEKTQKEYYLLEQMKAIQKELGKKDEFKGELDELKGKIKSARMSTEANEKAMREFKKLELMPPLSAEATVVRNYLDWLVSLPWSLRTKDTLNIDEAEKILNEDHYGLEKVKERILEYLSVTHLVKKLKGPILCLVGPPGVGKTSLARSISRATGRNFVRLSLGGVRDEAEIRGHRRTYIGSLPGRIIQSLKKAKSRNPVFLLDEVDKLGMDFRGDPAAALLEVLDPEQNHTFNDHYLEVDFDLSEIMFVTTANSTYSIPPPLLDRMEIISLPGYTEHEKVKIAQQYLVPKQLKANGVTARNIALTESVLRGIIQKYTREAGVRNLEREIASIFRKVARKVVSTSRRAKVSLTQRSLEKFLGVPKFHHGKAEGKNAVGIATGLAWTEHGGELLAIETTLMSGRGKLILTGKLGDVMKESAQAALSYIRTRAKVFDLPQDFYQKLDIHIHIPEGAIPKDGPSAGITLCTAMASALTRLQVKKDIAMTGELTLRGRVLPVGGIKEKMLAAHRAGLRTIILPKENVKDLKDLPEHIRKELKFVMVEHMDEVLTKALVRFKGKVERFRPHYDVKELIAETKSGLTAH
ncbi:endopeptidase La [Candidatus Moduliflexota bacterium]